jgi:two-component system, OmpR family, KDP operon response regulator KdpE
MKRVYVANPNPDERSALRLILVDLNMKFVGESSDWPSTLALAPATHPDMVLVDWGLVSRTSGNTLRELRRACQAVIVIILISRLNANDQAAISSGADMFISKGDPSNRMAERLQALAATIPAG